MNIRQHLKNLTQHKVKQDDLIPLCAVLLIVALVVIILVNVIINALCE